MLAPRLLRSAVLPLAAVLLLSATFQPAAAGPNDVFFSEYAEGSSNNKAVEIYNNTGVDIDLAAGGYKVRVYSNGNASPNGTINLTGTLLAGGVHVLANNAAPAAPCVFSPAPSQLSTSLNHNGNDALELVRGSGNEVLDVIGQIGVDPGAAGWGSDPVNTQDNTIRRKAVVITGDPVGDDVFDPAAQWDGFPNNSCDGFGSHTVDAGGTSFSIADASISEGDAGTAVMSFTVTKSGSGSASIDYATFDGTATEADGDYAFTAGTLFFGQGSDGADARQTIEVIVHGDTVDEGDETFGIVLSGAGVSFTRDTATGTLLNDDASCVVTHSIMQIQGRGHLSPLDGAAGITTRGVITQRDSNGFFMQDPQGDGDPDTSDGIFVFTGAAPAASLVAGDQVCVTGEVDEFRPGGVNVGGLTITELKNATIAEIDDLFADPTVTPTRLGAGGRPFPTTIIDNDTANGTGQGSVEVASQTHYDPAEDGIDFYESLEGMLVRIDNPVAVAPDPGNFGEIWMVSDGLTGHIGSGRNSRGGITLGEQDNNPERFMVSSSFSGASVPTAVDVGDSFTQNGQGQLVAIADYLYISGLSSGYYYFAPVAALTRVPGTNLPEVTAITGSADTLTVADYNVENLAFTSPQSKFDGLAAQIVNNLKSPDILALMEVQDNNGATDDGTVDAAQTLGRLRDAIAALPGAPHYEFVDVAPVDGADGGQPGGNIRLAYFYNPARVSLVSGTAGDAVSATQPQLDEGRLTLSLNPGRIDPSDPSFADARKSLAAVFEFNGRRVLIVSNHFSSKSGSDPAWGRFQPPANGSLDRRIGQATAVNKFVDAALALDPNARIVVLGDMNEFSFNEPLRILTGELGTGADNPIDVVLTDLADQALPPEERYTYVFEGQSQALDHLLVSDSLLPGAQIDILHINSEFDGQKSDHDPSLAALPLPPCSAGTLAFKDALLTASEGNADHALSVTVSRSGGDCGAVSARVSTVAATSGVAATAGADYVAVVGEPLSWADGDTADKTLTVTIKGDTLDEPDERFALQLSDAQGGAALGAAGEVVISDDDDEAADGSGRLSLSPLLETVTERPGAVARFTVRRLDAARGALSVDYATADLTARAGKDYTARSGTLSWAAGDDSVRIIEVPIIDDRRLELLPELFGLVLRNVTNGRIVGSPTAVGLILGRY